MSLVARLAGQARSIGCAAGHADGVTRLTCIGAGRECSLVASTADRSVGCQAGIALGALSVGTVADDA